MNGTQAGQPAPHGQDGLRGANSQSPVSLFRGRHLSEERPSGEASAPEAGRNRQVSEPVRNHDLVVALPFAAAAACLLAFLLWLSAHPARREVERVPLARAAPSVKKAEAGLNAGTLISGLGKPSAHAGSWPQFRGARRDNIAATSKGVAPAWPPEGPRVVWRIPVGEGYAGAAIHQGRVYLVDYDHEKKEDAIRCLSLDNGQEIWRYTYSVEVKRNHGMSRTVPAVNDRFVVALGPKCHVHCLEAASGQLVWKKDLVEEHGAAVPPWYAGQCPLIEEDRVILAPGGKPLMMAVDLATGKTIWQTEGCEGLGMTHSSIMPLDFNGRRQYVYCAQSGVVGVSAEDGRLLWTKPDWKISIANIPSPVPIGDGRIFFTGGYNAGSAMVRLKDEGGAWATEEIFRLKPTVFAVEQHTPILCQGRLYGVIPSGELVCLGLDGTPLWSSGPENRFGLGPSILVDGYILILDDKTGTLHLVKADPTGYNEIARAKLLNGPDPWGPMALAEGRLVLRDSTEMVCVELGG